MAMMHFDEIDDMFGRVDRMMNNVMRNMFGDPDPLSFGYNPMSNALMSPFGAFNALMPRQPSFNMNMINANPSSAYYCSSSVMRMSTDQHGRPQYYEETSSTRGGPGGLRETRSTLRDSARGLQAMSIGHHIHDRGHVVGQSRNYYTGEEEQNEEFVNMDEQEGRQFDQEWERRAHTMTNGGHHQRYLTGSHHHHLPGHSRHHRPQLALPAPGQQTSEKRSSSKVFGKKQKDKDKKKKPYNKPTG